MIVLVMATITPSMQPVIYVVDGDEQARQDLSKAIEGVGMRACGFASAEAFLQYHWRRHRACLVSEIDLPGISGLELLWRMGQLQGTIPTLLLTSRYEVPVAVQTIRLGAADLIRKPVRPRSLFAERRGFLIRLRTSRADIDGTLWLCPIVTHKVGPVVDPHAEGILAL
jgi:FixJ family two-component response regulator